MLMYKKFLVVKLRNYLFKINKATKFLAKMFMAFLFLLLNTYYTCPVCTRYLLHRGIPKNMPTYEQNTSYKYIQRCIKILI